MIDAPDPAAHQVDPSVREFDWYGTEYWLNRIEREPIEWVFMDAVMIGCDVLNYEEPTERAQRLVREMQAGAVAAASAADSHKIDINDDLVPYHAFVKSRLTHDQDGAPGEFDGWFIAEAYRGEGHPFLLVDPTRIVESEGASSALADSMVRHTFEQ